MEDTIVPNNDDLDIFDIDRERYDNTRNKKKKHLHALRQEVDQDQDIGWEQPDDFKSIEEFERVPDDELAMYENQADDEQM